MARTVTLGTHVAEEERRGLVRGVGAVLLELGSGVKAIAAVLARAVVCGAIGAAGGDDDPQAKLEALANDLLVTACAADGRVAAVASDQLPEPRIVFGRNASPLLVALDALEGTSNLCVNLTVGTVFSVLPRPDGVRPGTDAFLQPGTRQLCAGYALYGPTTMLVLTTGREVNGFTLDATSGEFVLTHPAMRVRDETREFAINASAARHWDRPVRRYVDECVAGGAGPRGADFDMRWVGSVVSGVHRVLVRGGTLMYPADGADGGGAGLRHVLEASPMAMIVEQAGGAASTGRGRRLDVVPESLDSRVPVILGSVVPDVHRVLARGGTVMYPADGNGGGTGLRHVYEASPMAMIVEQAGGAATTGHGRLLDVVPGGLDARVPAILGPVREVERIVAYHADPDGGRDRPYTSPLFNVRSLLRET